jgi:hypothetical protein
MVIFRFDNLISRISMKWGITWSTHLFTRHCFHKSHLVAFISNGNSGAMLLVKPTPSGAGYAATFAIGLNT